MERLAYVCLLMTAFGQGGELSSSIAGESLHSIDARTFAVF